MLSRQTQNCVRCHSWSCQSLRQKYVQTANVHPDTCPREHYTWWSQRDVWNDIQSIQCKIPFNIFCASWAWKHISMHLMEINIFHYTMSCSTYRTKIINTLPEDFKVIFNCLKSVESLLAFRKLLKVFSKPYPIFVVSVQNFWRSDHQML